MLNQVNIMGRLTADPVLQRTDTGRDVAHIVIACSRNYKDINGDIAVDFIDATLWDTLAQLADKFLAKGDLVVIEGHLNRINRQNPDGTRQWRLQLTGDKLHFTGSRRIKKETQTSTDAVVFRTISVPKEELPF